MCFFFADADSLASRFEYIHRTMNVSHERLSQYPQILYCREHRLKQRHEFLLSLGRAQYDPTKDLYVPFKSVLEGSDSEFALNVAKTSYKEFEAFLRTM